MPAGPAEPRTLVVHCPDWPVVAAGLADRPAAVLWAGRVVAASPAARAEGVRPGQRRREAEAACPALVIAERDVPREVGAFEKVVATVGDFAPRVEVTSPGVCSLPVRGPARYFGGEEALSTRLRRAVAESCAVCCRVGIADTPFAARLAAPRGLVVPPGETPGWLSGLPIAVLGRPGLTELLDRLGLHLVGDFARLEEGVIGERFGREGILAHRMARGAETGPLALEDVPVDLVVQRPFESPALQSHVVTFVASGAAEELGGRLAAGGLCCTLVLVEVESEHGEALSRWWRADRPFTPRAMVDRVRWQLEGWLSSSSAPTGGVTLVRLTAGEVVPDSGRQLDVFGDPSERSERVGRQVARIQGLLGHGAVGTAVVSGGRAFSEQARFVPFGEIREEPASARQPWPGRVPSPAPTVVFPEPVGVEVLGGEDGCPVGVTARGQLTEVPRSVAPCRRTGGPGAGRRPSGHSGGHGELAIIAWAGPWPAEERFWDLAAHRRRARLQVELSDGTAHLLVLENGRWAIEATYD